MTKQAQQSVANFDGPRRTALESIRAFCLQCMAGARSLVADCPSTECGFYGYRMGSISDGAPRQLLKVVKSYCAACAPEGDVGGCTAGRCYLSLDPCPVWPFRFGKNPHIGREQRDKLRQHAQRQYKLAGGEARFRPRIGGRGVSHG